MITIVPAAEADSALIAQLWNAKRLDPASCWREAEAADAQYVGQLLWAGFVMAIALVDETPSGFGIWFGPGGDPRLVALAADDDAVYYRLMDAFCDWGLALGAQRGYAEIGTAPTSEKARMDALGVIAYEPIGFEPLLPGQDPAQRVALLLRAQCELAVLKGAIAQMLEAAP